VIDEHGRHGARDGFFVAANATRVQRHEHPQGLMTYIIGTVAQRVLASDHKHCALRLSSFASSQLQAVAITAISFV
jgi:hypothetical protein